MKAFLRSFQFAFNGIRFAAAGRNFRVQLVIAVAVVLLASILNVHASHWVVLLIMIALVLSLEMINTALETVINLVSPQYHPLAGKVKDIAAGAVLVMSFFAAIVGIIIFASYLT